MNWMCAIVLTASAPHDSGPAVDEASVTAAHRKLERTVQTGTLLVTKGECLAVRVYTNSSYTHVGTVVLRNGKPVVYDSANASGVRRQKLKDYLRSQGHGDIYIFHPKRSLSAKRQKDLDSYLESQLGRPYAVAHHVTGERCDGVHCSEYATDGLQHCGLIKAKQPARVSPASLVRGITKHKVYAPGGRVQIRRSVPNEPESGTWYGRTWQCTRNCTVESWRKACAWITCR